jgi:hypothetical protein
VEKYSAGRVIVGVVGSLVIGGLGYLVMTSNFDDGMKLAFLICALFAIGYVTEPGHAKADQKDD